MEDKELDPRLLKICETCRHYGVLVPQDDGTLLKRCTAGVHAHEDFEDYFICRHCFEEAMKLKTEIKTEYLVKEVEKVVEVEKPVEVVKTVEKPVEVVVTEYVPADVEKLAKMQEISDGITKLVDAVRGLQLGYNDEKLKQYMSAMPRIRFNDDDGTLLQNVFKAIYDAVRLR